MLRLAAILLALAALLAAGCGDDDPPAAGPPAERFGADAVAGLLAVEEIRAELSPASDLYAIGRPENALVHLRAARNLWSEISGGIRRGDAVLEREVSAAFALVESTMSRGASFDTVRDRLAPLGGQLLGGVREELVPDKEARLDPGVSAATVVRLLDQAEAEYAVGGEREREHAFGLIDRSQATARDVAGDLGPRRDAVIEGLKALRDAAFPDELLTAPAKQGSVPDFAERSDRIRGALRDRFGL
jgi:hypothetical protein